MVIRPLCCYWLYIHCINTHIGQLFTESRRVAPYLLNLRLACLSCSPAFWTTRTKSLFRSTAISTCVSNCSAQMLRVEARRPCFGNKCTHSTRNLGSSQRSSSISVSISIMLSQLSVLVVLHQLLVLCSLADGQIPGRIPLEQTLSLHSPRPIREGRCRQELMIFDELYLLRPKT